MCESVYLPTVIHIQYYWPNLVFFSIFAKLTGEKYETKSAECESAFLNLDFNHKNRKHRNELTKDTHIEFERPEVHPHENLQKVFEHRDVEL